MPQAYAFWLCMILWAVLSLAFRWPDPATPRPWRVFLPDVFPFIALCLLGWHIFGPALK